MKPFNPKEYKRYIVSFNLFKNDCIRLIFLMGAKLTDTTKILEGDYKDGKRLVLFENMDAILEKRQTLQNLIKEWISMVE